jgi:hypothetical protein
MTLTEHATQDAQAVLDVQALLSSVTAQAAASAKSLADMAPSVSLIDSIITELDKVDPIISESIKAYLVQLRGLLNV